MPAEQFFQHRLIFRRQSLAFSQEVIQSGYFDRIHGSKGSTGAKDARCGFVCRAGFREIFRIWNGFTGTVRGVPASLETQFGRFLRDRRGKMTYAEFSRKLGLPPSTLHRLEQGAQSITLRGLQQIMRRLKCRLADIFPRDFEE